jgi:hypothetical protein
MKAALRRLVWSRARNRCEYCLLPADAASLSFCVDHIISRKHDGLTVAENLALSCFHCNSYKLDNIASVDSETRELARLFDPRTDLWSEHFAWNRVELVGLSAIGRVTVRILNMNALERLRTRKLLLAGGYVFS